MNSSRQRLASAAAPQQLENARLNGDIERRGDLVADQELWVGGERPCDRDPLFLAAAQLPGHAVPDARRKVNLLEELGDARGLVVAVERSKNWRSGRRTILPIDMRGLSELSGSWNTSWIRRRTSARPILRKGAEWLRLEAELAGHGPMEAGEAAAERRLAAAALADDRQARSRRQRERDRRATAIIRLPSLPDSQPPCRDTPPRDRSLRGSARDRRRWAARRGRLSQRRSTRGRRMAPPRASSSRAEQPTRVRSPRAASRHRTAAIRMSQRGANGQPAGLFHGSTALPRDAAQLRACRLRREGSLRAVAACTDARDRGRCRRPAPVSTTRPPYMTATASTRFRTTPRSWLT